MLLRQHVLYAAGRSCCYVFVNELDTCSDHLNIRDLAGLVNHAGLLIRSSSVRPMPRAYM